MVDRIGPTGGEVRMNMQVEKEVALPIRCYFCFTLPLSRIRGQRRAEALVPPVIPPN